MRQERITPGQLCRQLCGQELPATALLPCSTPWPVACGGHMSLKIDLRLKGFLGDTEPVGIHRCSHSPSSCAWGSQAPAAAHSHIPPSPLGIFPVAEITTSCHSQVWPAHSQLLHHGSRARPRTVPWAHRTSLTPRLLQGPLF